MRSLRRTSACRAFLRFTRATAPRCARRGRWTTTTRWPTRWRSSESSLKFWRSFRRATPISASTSRRTRPACSTRLSSCWRRKAGTSSWSATRIRASTASAQPIRRRCCAFLRSGRARRRCCWRTITAPRRRFCIWRARLSRETGSGIPRPSAPQESRAAGCALRTRPRGRRSTGLCWRWPRSGTRRLPFYTATTTARFRLSTRSSARGFRTAAAALTIRSLPTALSAMCRISSALPRRRTTRSAFCVSIINSAP